MSVVHSAARPSVVDIDRADLIRMGGDVFRELERGTIFYLHKAEEVLLLREHILATLSHRISAEWLGEVRGFFESGSPMSRGALRELLMCLRELRDSRYVSCLFSDLIAGFGLPAPVLVDLAACPGAEDRSSRAGGRLSWAAAGAGGHAAILRRDRQPAPGH
jgi:hypothetical protein